ncbi:MAG TPA: EscE/YscE/SsaE family type III secretion system needle protein co-chaperone [Geminicoccaceae bacterium]|nr:EscE/YscE/SsaE family type III secretion system needle protein co-chaperone [Geminicoccus sp.]HMU48206.1 EscE/YscE/SsaE family type III secretion system needle protein co-chaperone [Geminicoccaceae bacterium]
MAATVVDLDRRLAADDSGWERDTLMEELREYRRETRRQLDKGVPPERYAALNATIAAIDAAVEILPLLWIELRASRETSKPLGR